MGRLLGVKLRKHKYILKEGHFDISKLALHDFEEGHQIDWTQEPILQIEPHPTFWKCKETAHKLCSDNSITQPSLKISHILFTVY
jgi:hypothetical protein